jgi:hypothetical protein
MLLLLLLLNNDSFWLPPSSLKQRQHYVSTTIRYLDAAHQHLHYCYVGLDTAALNLSTAAC